MSENSVDKALVRVEDVPVALDAYGAAVPKTLDEQLRFCKWAVESGIVPAKRVPEAFVVMQRGGELGFRGLAAFDFLYVVNGRVRITPDGCKAKALGSGLLLDQREELVGEGDSLEAVVTIRRKDVPTPFVGRFSVADAKLAKLWGKVGRDGGPSAWVTYPKRMLLARARGFAYGDAFKDLVGGLPVRDVADLDPGESLGMPASEPRPTPQPPSGPDPLLIEDAEVIVGCDPGPPFQSHAEADREIAAEEE